MTARRLLVSREGRVTVIAHDEQVGPIVSALNAAGEVEPYPLAALGELVELASGGQAFAIPSGRQAVAPPLPEGHEVGTERPEGGVRTQPPTRGGARAMAEAVQRARGEGEAAGRQAAHVEGVEFSLPRGVSLCGIVPPDPHSSLAGCLGGSVFAGGVALAWCYGFLWGLNPGAGITTAALAGLWLVHSTAAIWAAYERARARLQYWSPVVGSGGAYKWRVEDGRVQVWASREAGGRGRRAHRQEGWRDVEEFAAVQEGETVKVRAGIDGWLQDGLTRIEEGLEEGIRQVEARERAE